MKKHLLLLVFALAASAFIQAQEVDYVPFHYMGYELFMIENMIQQRDGDIVTCTYVAVAESNFSEPRLVVRRGLPLPLSNLSLLLSTN